MMRVPSEMPRSRLRFAGTPGWVDTLTAEQIDGYWSERDFADNAEAGGQNSVLPGAVARP